VGCTILGPPLLAELHLAEVQTRRAERVAAEAVTTAAQVAAVLTSPTTAHGPIITAKQARAQLIFKD
jgi:hypothetical protein